VRQELSKRAQRFLQTQERRPHVQELGLLSALLEEAGVPVTQPILDFHRTFAGYPIEVYLEEGTLGIIHPAGVSLRYVEPMKVGGYIKGEESLLTCADFHPSYEMMIALDGTFYCDGPESSSYFLWTEQCAFQQEFHETRGARVLRTAAAVESLAAVFLPRVTRYRIDALSDQYCQLYATDDFVVSVGQQGQRYHVLMAEGSDAEFSVIFGKKGKAMPPGATSGPFKARLAPTCAVKYLGKLNPDSKGFEPGESVKGGLASDIFNKSGIVARLEFAPNGQVTQILVSGGKN
jgi:hypothetical protein